MNCKCGADLGNGATLKKVGWQNLHDGDGGFALLVNCHACHTTLSLRAISDAAQCHVCHRVVTGRSDENDPKVHALEANEHGKLHHRMLCRQCASRTGTGYQAVSIYFAGWVRSDDDRLLQSWREMWPGHLPRSRKAG